MNFLVRLIATIGTITATLLSYTTHHSVPWTFINGVFGWFYVVYWVLAYGIWK